MAFLGYIIKSKLLCMSSPARPTTIEDLPPEMINELFKHLSPKDQFVCSMVNKRWHSIYAALKVHTLIATENPANHLGNWYHSARRFEVHHRCRMGLFSRLAGRPLLSNLKHLALCETEPTFDLNQLNRFRQLVQLEIMVDGQHATEVNLSLPKLQVLTFGPTPDSWYREYKRPNYCLLSIDCPELSVLVHRRTSEYTHMLNVRHPQTIRKLDADIVGPVLLRFKGVECLVTRQYKAISQATLQSLPRLKELRFNEDIPSTFWREVHIGTDPVVYRMKRTLSEFVAVAKASRGPDFKFIFAGFELSKTSVDMIEFGLNVFRINGEPLCNEYLYAKNYQLLDPDAKLDFIRSVDYSRLVAVTGEIPVCLLQKFAEVTVVTTSRVAPVQDAARFLRFLNTLRLRHLCLEDTVLGQEFYDQLPASARSLVSLKLGKHNELPSNFDFIREFPCLRSFIIAEGHFSFASLASLVRSLGQSAVGNFKLSFKGNKFRVFYSPFSKWVVYQCDSSLVRYGVDEHRGLKTVVRNENPEKVVSFFKQFKSKAPKRKERIILILLLPLLLLLFFLRRLVRLVRRLCLNFRPL